jgi:malonate-semialdehyde dehydrogenase (acetylating) / methylmalonate-semialdehyde dehydrogenase
MKYPVVTNFVGGAATAPSGALLDVFDPSAGEVISKVSLSTAAEVDHPVQTAKLAFAGWSATPIKDRAQVFYRYKALLERYTQDLARLIVEENGKVLSEAVAEVERGMECVEYACSLPQVAHGEILEVSRGVDCRIDRWPLGVVASITPFNFPNMVPNWTIPNALCLGNAMILKPSELVPLSSIRLAELLLEAGLPKGVFNVVQGGQDAVEAICDHPDVEAISFVGSTRVAKAVYRRGTSQLKRVLALGGAKNHLVVMPDADREMAAGNIVASMAGCAGQRCMAASVMVAVAQADHVIRRMVEVASQLVPGRTLGPVISAEAKARIERYIDEAEAAGATVVLDGRHVTVAGREGGFYVGPTIIDHVTPEMKIAQDEVFGPVLAIIRARDVDEAIEIENRSPYGNAASVYTESGGVAKHFAAKAHAGMLGINVGVPVPREPFSFGGWNESKFGVGDITGRGSVEFWTKSRKTTIKWNREAGTNWMS